MARKVIALKDALGSKADELWDKAEFQATSAQNLLAASAKAQEDSQVAAKHAAAVAEALLILDNAGVVL